jgi:hypothetical protein
MPPSARSYGTRSRRRGEDGLAPEPALLRVGLVERDQESPREV